MPKSAHHDEDQLNFKAENIGSKWVKTDSECEFLYIYIYIYKLAAKTMKLSNHLYI